MRAGLLLFVWFAAVTPTPAVAQEEIVEVSAAAAPYNALREQAMRFLTAVRDGDTTTLAALTVVSARAAVRKDLENATSPLSRILLTGSRAIRGRFMNVNAPTVALFRRRDAEPGEPTIVCFADPRLQSKRATTTAELPPLDSNRSEVCVSFVQAARRWAIVYDFVSGQPD